MKNAGTTAIAGQRTFRIHRRGQVPPPSGRSLFATVKDALPLTGVREVDLYRLRNLINIWRGFWRILAARVIGVPTHYGALYATIRRANGDVVRLGLVSLRVVTDAGVNFIVDAFQNTTEVENFQFHGYGTGTNAEAAGNTTLQTELTTQYATDNTRPTGSRTEGASANIYRSVGTLSPDATVAITEHGVFSAASGGTLLDRSVFSAVNLVSGDSLQTTYDLTFTSGG